MKNTKPKHKRDAKFYVKNPQIGGKNHGENMPKFTMII